MIMNSTKNHLKTCKRKRILVLDNKQIMYLPFLEKKGINQESKTV